jgi:hypothetical protein
MFAAISPAMAQTVDLDPGSSERVAAPAASAVAPAPADPLRFSSEGLTAVAMPGGGVTVDLEGRFKHYLVAHKGPDGTLHMGCTQDPDGAHSHSAAGVELSE